LHVKRYREFSYALSLALMNVLLWMPHSVHAKADLASHTPPSNVQENSRLELTIDLKRNKKIRGLRLRFRKPGEHRYQKIEGIKQKRQWVLTVPSSEIKPPYIEYFIVAESLDGRAHLVFASPQEPFQLMILSSEKNQRPKEPASLMPVKTEEHSIETPVIDKGTEQPSALSDVGNLSQPSPSASSKPEIIMPVKPPPSTREVSKDTHPFLTSEMMTALVGMDSQKVSLANAMVSIVGRERIEAMGARDLKDILKTVPGMETALSVTGFDLVSMRGLQNDARILLLVDGQPFFNPYDGRNYWNLSASQIERVEVIRGPGAVLYGAGAMTSVILVETRKREGLELLIEGGSFDTFKGGISLGKTQGAHGLFLNTNLQYTSGPSLVIESDALSEANVQRSLDDMKTHAAGLSGGVTAAYDYIFGAKKKTTLASKFKFFGEQRGPYIGYFDTVGPESKLNWLLWDAQLVLEHAFSENTALYGKVYGSQNRVDRLLQLAPQGFSTPDRNNDGNIETFAEGVLAQLSYETLQAGTEARFFLKPSSAHKITTGANIDITALPEGVFELRFNRDLNGVAQVLGAVEGLQMPQNDLCRFYETQSMSGLSACRLTLAAFVKEEWKPSSSFSGTLGLRFSSFSDLDFDIASGLTPKLALVWEPLSRWVIKAMAATSFRAPTFEEKYDQTPLAFADQSAGLLLGNPTLQPEIMNTLELGTGYSFNLMNTQYQMFINGFVSHAGQVIEHIDETGSLSELSNQEGYDMMGLEGEARLSFADGHFLFVNSSWHRTYWGHQVVDGEPSCDLWPWENAPSGCTLITDIPQLRTNMGAHFDLGSLGDLAVYGHTGAMRKNNWRSQLEQMRTYEIPAYTIANAVYHSPEIGEGFKVRLLARNILQEEIKDPVPRPDADRMPGLLPKPGFEAFAQIIWSN
jgi:hypothetical protein